jgi:hypothetical protein
MRKGVCRENRHGHYRDCLFIRICPRHAEESVLLATRRLDQKARLDQLCVMVRLKSGNTILEVVQFLLRHALERWLLPCLETVDINVARRARL